MNVKASEDAKQRFSKLLQKTFIKLGINIEDDDEVEYTACKIKASSASLKEWLSAKEMPTFKHLIKLVSFLIDAEEDKKGENKKFSIDRVYQTLLGVACIDKGWVKIPEILPKQSSSPKAEITNYASKIEKSKAREEEALKQSENLQKGIRKIIDKLNLVLEGKDPDEGLSFQEQAETKVRINLIRQLAGDDIEVRPHLKDEKLRDEDEDD